MNNKSKPLAFFEKLIQDGKLNITTIRNEFTNNPYYKEKTDRIENDSEFSQDMPLPEPLIITFEEFLEDELNYKSNKAFESIEEQIQKITVKEEKEVFLENIDSELDYLLLQYYKLDNPYSHIIFQAFESLKEKIELRFKLNYSPKFINGQLKFKKLNFNLSRIELTVLFLSLKDLGIISDLENDYRISRFLENFCTYRKEGENEYNNLTSIKSTFSKIRNFEVDPKTALTKVKDKLAGLKINFSKK